MQENYCLVQWRDFSFFFRRMPNILCTSKIEVQKDAPTRSRFLPFNYFLLRKTQCVSLRETQRQGNTTRTITKALSVFSKAWREKKTQQLHFGGKHWQVGGFTVLLYLPPPPQKRRCVQEKGNRLADGTCWWQLRVWPKLISRSV